MEFPVDTLATVDPGSLEQSAKSYMSKLLFRNSEIHEYLNIPGSKKIEIGLCNVSFVPLYGVDAKQKCLALFSPDEPLKAVGLYLLDQWWSAEDILKTADSSRTGLIKVRTPGERIVLYVLNRIIYRTKEMVGDDVPFPCHGEDEIAKILWKNGEAIGFYSVKPEGSLCKKFLTHCYQIPVMDTIFIRKDHRGHGHGLQMLKDFIISFRQEIVGFSYPLSPAMYKVCKKYLSLYPDDTELLWEIVDVGSPFQRTQIARKLHAMDLKANHQVIGKLNFETEESDLQKEVQGTMEFMEIVEEEVVQIKITKDAQGTPVTTLGRSSNLKRKKLAVDTEEKTEKIIRVEDIESDVQCAEDDPVQEDGKISLNLKESQLKDTMETLIHDSGHPISDITHLQCEEQNKLNPETTHQSETKKAEEVKESKDVIDKDIGRETSEGIVEIQKDQTDMAETINKEDIEDEVEMGKISVVENIVGDTEETDVEKEEAGALEVSFLGKEQSEQVEEKDCLGQSTTDDQNSMGVDNKMNVNNAEASEPSVAGHLEEQEEEPALAEDCSDMEATLKCQTAVVTLVESTDKQQVVEMSDNEIGVRVEDKNKDSNCEEREVRHDKIEENIISKDEDKVPEPILTEEHKIEEAQEEGPMKEPNMIQSEEPKIMNIGSSLDYEVGETSKDDEKIVVVNIHNTEVVRDAEVEVEGQLSEPFAAESVEEQEEEPASETGPVGEDNSTEETRTQKLQNVAVTLLDFNSIPLRHESSLKHQAAESELTQRVLRSSTKAAKATSKTKVVKHQVKTKQPVDDAEVEQMKDTVEEKIESVRITTETEHEKAVELEVEGKTLGQCGGEPVEEHEEEPASETGPEKDDNTEKATSDLKQQKVAVVLMDSDKVSATHTDAGKDAKGTSQPLEYVELELHKQSTDTESQAEHTEKEQAVETDETVEREEGDLLNDEDRAPKSAFMDEVEENEANLVTPLRCSRRLKDQAAGSELTKSVLRTSARLTNKATPQQRHKQQIKAMMQLEEPKQRDESKNNEMSIILGTEVAVGEHMESETVHVSHGNDVEENTRSEDVVEQDKMAPEYTKHGEVEQICTSEYVKEDEDKIQDNRAATEMAHGEDLMESTPTLTLQKASVVLVDVIKDLPNLTGEFSCAFAASQEERSNKSEMSEQAVDIPEEVMEELQTEADELMEELATDLAPEEDMENAAESTSMLKLHQVDMCMDFQRQSGESETDRNETTQSQEDKLLSKDNIANEEKELTEMNVTENVTERKDEEQAVVVEMGIDNTLITNDEQVGDILAKEDVKDDLKEIEDTTLKGTSTSKELDTNKTLVEWQESTTPAQGDSVQESRNSECRTVPVKHTQERKSGHLQNIYKETKINENTEEESSDEDVETVFTRHLRGRTVKVTPRRPKCLKVTQAAELEMGVHVTNEIVAVQFTEEARTAVEEMHETNSKYDNEEIPAVSEAERKDQRQDNDVSGNDAEKVEEVTDGRNTMIGETVDRKEVETKRRDILEEVDLPDENQEKEVRSANSKQECDQQDHALEETLLKKTFEKELRKRVEEKYLQKAKDSAINILNTDQSVSLDQSENGEGVERRALRKRTITIKPTSVRKSKRLCKQDHGQNDGQTVEWANTEDSAPVEETVMEMTDVQSHKENEPTDQGKGQEIEDTDIIGGEISQNKTYGNAENSQENTVTGDKTELLCMSEEDSKLMQEEEKVEWREKVEKIMESENNAGKSEKIADKPQEVEDTQEEPEQSEKNVEEAQVPLDENFMELDEEIVSNGKECNQVVAETKASFQESEKEITDTEQESGVKSAAASPGQRSASRRRGLLLDFQSAMEDKSEADKVKEVIQQKRKPVDERRPRRSKRLARAEIV